MYTLFQPPFSVISSPLEMTFFFAALSLFTVVFQNPFGFSSKHDYTFLEANQQASSLIPPKNFTSVSRR